jgi:hypothetical protein
MENKKDGIAEDLENGAIKLAIYNIQKVVPTFSPHPNPQPQISGIPNLPHWRAGSGQGIPLRDAHWGVCL